MRQEHDVSRLAALPSSAVADALGRTGAIGAPLSRLAGTGRFAGVARTVDCRGPAPRSIGPGVETCSHGDVLVIDARGTVVPAALVGELVATELVRRGVVAVVVVAGYVRDLDILRRGTLSVYAGGVTPLALLGATAGTVGVSLEFEGCAVDPGDVLVGDDDGVVVVKADLVPATITKAEAIVAREGQVAGRVIAGENLFDVLRAE